MPRRPFRASAAAGVLLFTLIVAACGGASAAPAQPDQTQPAATDAAATQPADPAAPTPGTALDACEIVTADDVRAALEIPDDVEIADGELEESPTTLSPGHTECTYTAGDDGSGGRVIVSLTPEDGANLYDAARGAYDDAVDITGTGADGAFFSEGENRSFVWKGAVTVLLTVFPAGTGWSYEQAEAFAASIIAKL